MWKHCRFAGLLPAMFGITILLHCIKLVCLMDGIQVSTKIKGELHSPQSEAAMFYGLFLRGHSADDLRAAIDVSPHVFQKWMRLKEYDPSFQERLKQMYQYRKRVLAIFDSLIMNHKDSGPWQ